MRTILVFGDKTFRINVPEDATLTFGPFSPPRKDNNFRSDMDKAGTLRVYGKTKATVLAVFSGVSGFRDMSLGYAEQVAREEGATIWKDDEQGYMREHKVQQTKSWVVDPAKALTGRVVKAKKGRK
jgi:hypothetical protein